MNLNCSGQIGQLLYKSGTLYKEFSVGFTKKVDLNRNIGFISGHWITVYL